MRHGKHYRALNRQRTRNPHATCVANDKSNDRGNAMKKHLNPILQALALLALIILALNLVHDEEPKITYTQCPLTAGCGDL
jgi:hypothetical protein